MFAEILRQCLELPGVRIGHFDSDNFAAILTGQRLSDALDLVAVIAKEFEQASGALYDAEARQRGYVIAKRRDNTGDAAYPLVHSIAVVVEKPAGSIIPDANAFSARCIGLWRKAKSAASKVASETWVGESGAVLPPKPAAVAVEQHYGTGI